MFLSIREMEMHPIHFQKSFPPGRIEFFDPRLRQVTSLDVQGTASLVGSTEEIRVAGHVSAQMEVDCDRCLEPARFPIDSDFELVYRPDDPSGGSHEVFLADGESEVGFYDGSGLELVDVLREQVLLSMPMQRVCREECRGICPDCGQNRNDGQCQCRPIQTGDRRSELPKARIEPEI